MESSLLLFLVLTGFWAYCIRENSELIIPGLVVLYLLFCMIENKRHEYLSTPDENKYIEHLQAKCLHVVDDSVKKVPIKPYKSSFTENKNKIFVCTKDKKGNYFSENDLVYVLLHEYAHATTKVKEAEHGPAWLKNFNRYLERAKELKIYDPSQPLSMEYMSECSG